MSIASRHEEPLKNNVTILALLGVGCNSERVYPQAVVSQTVLEILVADVYSIILESPMDIARNDDSFPIENFWSSEKLDDCSLVAWTFCVLGDFSAFSI